MRSNRPVPSIPDRSRHARHAPTISSSQRATAVVVLLVLAALANCDKRDPTGAVQPDARIEDAGEGGALQVTGGAKHAVVATPSGARALYTGESSEVYYGFGKLERGRARILLDPSFAQTVSTDEPYHVFVQPYGRAELYVAERTPIAFTIVLKDGDPDAEFTYRVVAERLAFDGPR